MVPFAADLERILCPASHGIPSMLVRACFTQICCACADVLLYDDNNTLHTHARVHTHTHTHTHMDELLRETRHAQMCYSL